MASLGRPVTPADIPVTRVGVTGCQQVCRDAGEGTGLPGLRLQTTLLGTSPILSFLVPASAE